MTRPRLKHLALFGTSALVLVACGTQQIKLDSADRGNDRIVDGATIFSDKCSGCHTLEAAGTQGSAVKVRNRERTDGPNFNVRPEDRDAVLYAIRNGGFSGAIMPENIVVGDDAQKVAEFLSKYAGRQAPKTPGQASPDT
jgi:mono/diheme cytochrome c family protein